MVIGGLIAPEPNSGEFGFPGRAFDFCRPAMQFASTESASRGRRLKYWEDLISSIYTDTAVELPEGVNFYGEIAWRTVGDIMLSEINSSEQKVYRHSNHIRRKRTDLVQVNIQIEGFGHLAQDDRQAISAPGEFFVFDSARPYVMRFDGPFRSLSIDFPRDLLCERIGSTGNITARTLSGRIGVGRFLVAYAEVLIRQPELDDLSYSARLQDHVIELLETALSGLQSSPSGPAISASRRMTLCRVKDYIRKNLRRPDLSPVSIASACGLSIRTLYSLFEAERSTVARWIISERLERCRAEIEAASFRGRSLTEIAFSWGFSDSAHFSRAFRKRFGLSPRQCRQQSAQRSRSVARPAARTVKFLCSAEPDG